jgi:hypothetical protein
MEERPPIWRLAANTLNKQSRTSVLHINQLYILLSPENEMGVACSSDTGGERHIQGFGGKPEGK